MLIITIAGFLICSVGLQNGVERVTKVMMIVLMVIMIFLEMCIRDSYDTVRILLGTDTALEEKMTRVAAILPSLSGLSGELHMEDYKDRCV